MSEADDLARRYLALWADYLSALLADPQVTEPVRRWLVLVAETLHGTLPADAAAGDPPRPSAATAAAAGPSGERDAVVVDLARRVDELSRRVAALERARKPRAGTVAAARRRNRSARP